VPPPGWAWHPQLGWVWVQPVAWRVEAPAPRARRSHARRHHRRHRHGRGLGGLHVALHLVRELTRLIG
jgi:hypothetical protein